VDPEITVTHLSIVDGAWQQAPDNLACVDEAGRGTLYLICEVAGDSEGRDSITRELIETVRREYVASRGSVTFALTEAVRAANNLLYDANANAPREARRYAGMTAAVLRERELFVVQGGPGLTCLVRAGTLARFPKESPWFDALFDPGQAQEEYSTGGAVPIGIRREYTPDSFHVTLQPADSVLFSTRSLTHLLTDEELLNTVAQRRPDEIVENLEDFAGSLDLSVITMVCGPVAAFADQPASQSTTVPPSPVQEQEETETAKQELPAHDTPETQARDRLSAPLARVSTMLAQRWQELDVTRIGIAGEQGMHLLLRGLTAVALASIRTFLPDNAGDPAHAPGLERTRRQAAWRLAALVFPFLLVLIGGGAWINYRSDVTRLHAVQIDQLTVQANTALEAGKNSARVGDKPAARTAFEKAKSLAAQMQAINPNHPAVRKIAFEAEDQLDTLNGISVLSSVVKFAAVGAQANRERIVTHWPDIFILDHETQRIYRFAANEAGSNAAPISADGVILKTGDKVGERGIGDLIDIFWIDGGRLVALDRSGAFLQYDPAKSAWTLRPASDGSQWARVSLAASYAGNLYLLDPSKSQILKYAPNEGGWSPGVTYLAPGVNVDLSSAVDMAIDGDVWVLRGDGSLWRLASGRLADFTLRDLETPLAKPTALTTAQAMVGLYVVDAGNQRIVQFDKATGRSVRQLRPGSENRDAFTALKAVAVDEANRKLVFINGNQVYLATIPQ
jgi:hypothetical protein